MLQIYVGIVYLTLSNTNNLPPCIKDVNYRDGRALLRFRIEMKYKTCFRKMYMLRLVSVSRKLSVL